MGSWKLDVGLLSNIIDICGRPVRDTMEVAGVKYTSWKTWLEVESGSTAKRTPEKGGIPVVALLSVCNALCVPVRKLFCKQGEPERSMHRQELVAPKNHFTPCRFDREAFKKTFGLRSEGGMSVGKMLGELGYTFSAYANWLEEDSTLRVAQLLRFCDMYGYDLFSFLIDSNTDCLNRQEKVVSCPVLETEEDKVRKENASLRKRNRKLVGELKEARMEAERLSGEVSGLKVKNMELEYEMKRLKQHIEANGGENI